MDSKERQSGGDQPDPTSYAETGIRSTGHQLTDSSTYCYTTANQAPGADGHFDSVFIDTL